MAECRPRRRPLSSPSAYLLALLAAQAAQALPTSPSPTDPPDPTPTPAPPFFLCPSLSPSSVPANAAYARPHSLCTPRPSGTWSWPSHDVQSTPPPKTKILPDRYVKGSDGFWRKVEEYTLYGSTVCEVCFSAFNRACADAIPVMQARHRPRCGRRLQDDTRPDLTHPIRRHHRLASTGMDPNYLRETHIPYSYHLSRPGNGYLHIYYWVPLP